MILTVGTRKLVDILFENTVDHERGFNVFLQIAI